MEPMTTLGTAAPLPTRKPETKRTAHSSWTEQYFGWLLAAPGMLVILALSVYPLGYSLWVAFVNYDFLVPGHAFVGWRNFSEVLADPVAIHAVVVTLVLAGLNVFLEFVLGFALALAMSASFRGRSVLMSLFIVPLFVSPVIVGQFWALLLQKPFGPTDYLLSLLLRHPVEINWLSQFPWNFIALMLADAWQWTPFMFVILLAGLSALPAEPYEAAEMDGASHWQSFVHITLPQMGPMMLLAVTFRLLDAVKLFDTVFMMTGGGPGSSTYTVSFYLYQIGFAQFHLSEATAGSWMFLVLTLVGITFLVRRLMRTEAR
jgi:multiple sugar transport system permease protein